ncbi:MAG TPA: AraC family transcriptional regulator [Acidocella sp.]|jgi:transcriptional regulator GlxA family with amidase domain|nr:AraC family transcriptional regulator [Acidocella sp.]
MKMGIMSAPPGAADLSVLAMPRGFIREDRNWPSGGARGRRIQAVQDWILEHLPLEHSVSALAGRAAMSVRHFARVFREETGLTPGQFVELARVNMARILLEGSEMPLKRVAAQSGFVNATVMRAAFRRWVGVGPRLYRLQCRA